jgi:glycolate oxidase FAD binding subunit
MQMMTPESETALAEVILAADGPLRIVGGGTRSIGSASGQELSTSGLSGISLYEPGAMTIVAGAGTPLSTLNEALAAENQRLAFEPMDHRGLLGTSGTPTIGGVVAANVSGPRRIQAGAGRDALLGVRFVDGTGRVLKNGGRVMKNVTGYDLVKLMAGSWGTLGVLTEVSLKVLPVPEATGVVLMNGLRDADAVRALSMALGSPFDVTGAAHTPRGVDGDPVTMIRVEGFADSVDYRTQQLQSLLAEFGPSTVETDPQRTAEGWKWVRDVQAFHGLPGDVWRFSVKPSDGPVLAAQLAQEWPDTQVLYDWGGGLVWALLPQGVDARLPGLQGHATRVRGENASVPAFHPEPAPLAAISAGLRAKFDPKAILNPGMMG